MSCQRLTLEERYVSVSDAGDCQNRDSYCATKLRRLMRIEAPYSHSIVAGGLPEIS